MEIEFSRYTLGGPNQPLRKGLLLRLRDGSNLCAYSELAPLPEPGFSRESLEEAEEALRGIKLPTFPMNKDEQAALIETVVPAAMPSLRWAMEILLGDAASRLAGVPLAEWWAGTRLPKTLPINALVPKGSTAAMIGDSLARGFTSFKVKVDGSALSTIDALLELTRTILPPTARIRFDANRSLDVKTASRFLLSWQPVFALEYIEEPLQSCDREDFAALAKATSVPLALDETLWLAPQLARTLFTERLAQVAVLKPCMLGGYAGCLRLLSELPEGVSVAVTSTMELGPAYVAGIHAAIALSACADVLPCGFDTLEGFGRTYVPPAFAPQQGACTVSDVPGLGFDLPADLPWEKA